ncbi:MAG: beta-lactamase family protein [bacterium]|nr:beta-lactamase family protein [bacterium]
MICAPLLVAFVSPILQDPAGAAEPAVLASPEVLAGLLEAARAEQELVGLAAAVIVDGKIHYSAGFGHADREKEVPVTGDTLFRWASISKPLTAIAAMQLVEKEQLDLGLDVREYVPEFPEKDFAITARQLLCHQSGIVHYRNGKVVRTEREYDVENPFADVVLALDTFKASPLVHVPGEDYAYTTHGYILLSAVVQRAGKQPFAQQVHERIAKPLGMTSLEPDYQWKEIPGRAVGYTRLYGIIVRSTNTDVSWKLGGGGFLSNVDDLARLAIGLIGDDLLSEEARTVAWTAQETNKGKATGYGLGFGVARIGESLRIGHTGSQEKTRTLMWLFPAEEIGVALMSNSQYANLRPIASRVMDAVGAPAAKERSR